MEIKLLNNPDSFKYNLKIFLLLQYTYVVGLILYFIFLGETDALEVF